MRFLMKAALPMALVVAPIGAKAEVCASKEVIEGALSRYEEEPRWLGLSRDGVAIQLYLNEDTGTWTIIAVSPEGRVCALLEGEAGSLIPPQPKGEDS